MLAFGIKTFDGGDFFARGLRNRGLTGAHRLTIEVDRAGAAQASATSEFGTGHLQMFVDDPGCVKTLRGITAPGILGSTVTRRAKNRKNLSSARHCDQIRFRFYTAKTQIRHGRVEIPWCNNFPAAERCVLSYEREAGQ